MDTKNTDKKPFPKNAFDSEYQTEYLREVRFLAEKGIKYTFVRKTKDYGISQFKYTKTSALFSALVEFYSMIEAEREAKKKEMGKEVALSPDEIKQMRELLQKAEKMNVPHAEPNGETKDDTE